MCSKYQTHGYSYVCSLFAGEIPEVGLLNGRLYAFVILVDSTKLCSQERVPFPIAPAMDQSTCLFMAALTQCPVIMPIPLTIQHHTASREQSSLMAVCESKEN